MLFTKISALTFAAVAAAVVLPSSDEVAAKLGIPAVDVNELLSTTDVSSLDITKYAKALNIDPKEVSSWPDSVKAYTLEQLHDSIQSWIENGSDERTQVAKRQNSNRDRVQAEVNGLIARYRSEHEADHGRRLGGCPSTRCSVCAAALTATYLAALTACGAASVTEEAISAGTLTPLAVTQLGACVGAAHGTYAGGWTFCLGMTN
ncbi:hypothetical protein FOVG_18678 [Fusarium oxysporum f. sp. pisi HDV247]|uniref:Uncharacterized protein n=1 Tax=Fusarium oxysporum f. sp. pisi HDV247 TaxID=1080344 RepID=W9NPY3_FUSOX|nr:hypothetical protein FOVG_18678 [Fusarium oxysporum f. sp. pisi HDV247]KAH7191179.1 hypothetical protein DER44DRAFT_105012 [Fusarium oxysporum]